MLEQRRAASPRRSGSTTTTTHMHHTNTVKAHELLHYAKAHGRQLEMKEALLKAYFVDGGHVGRIDDLADLAAEARLRPRRGACAALTDDEYLAAVKADLAQAAEYGINGVPFFVFDGQYGVSGAQETATFANVLEQVRTRRSARRMTDDGVRRRRRPGRCRCSGMPTRPPARATLSAACCRTHPRARDEAAATRRGDAVSTRRSARSVPAPRRHLGSLMSATVAPSAGDELVGVDERAAARARRRPSRRGGRRCARRRRPATRSSIPSGVIVPRSYPVASRASGRRAAAAC